MDEAAENWSEANQRELSAALDRLRGLLARYLEPATEASTVQHGPSAEDAGQGQSVTPGSTPSALSTVAAAFGLSPFERDLLLLCAGFELDSRFAACFAAFNPKQPYPTFSLALAVLPGAHWSAINPAAPLRRYHLLELGAGEALTQSPLRIDERVLHYLTGISHLDERLVGLLTPLATDLEAPPSYVALAERIVAIWQGSGQERGWPVVQLSGDAAASYAAASCAVARIGERLYLLHAGDIPATPAEREQLARLWEREAALTGDVLLLDCDDGVTAEALRPACRFAEATAGLLIVVANEPLQLRKRAVVRLDAAPASAGEQLALWQDALGDHAARLDGHLDAMVAQFSLSPSAIRSVAVSALAGTPPAAAQISYDALWDSCRIAARPRLEDLATLITAAACWDDLVLPEAQRETLREIAIQVRNRRRVYDEWGFAAQGGRGLGISALFAGASGTGKTMAAEALASTLRLDLYRIDLSQVVSKYIGETEKNLRRVFDAAEAGGAILLFDEADALFGKRSEVKDSHDRYANIEVSYLLQRMEAYRGLAILTTNLKAALDPAFLRRIRFVVNFPFPDAASRAEIWRRIFPAATPTAGLDVDKLARLAVAGGNIRNIALSAAFLAADESQPVGMRHLLRAARSECAKLERPLSEAEIGGWT